LEDNQAHSVTSIYIQYTYAHFTGSQYKNSSTAARLCAEKGISIEKYML